ncbi:MAG: hypothetical protein ACI9SD_001907, partial [Pseudohongiellaceae bacterium]
MTILKFALRCSETKITFPLVKIQIPLTFAKT